MGTCRSSTRWTTSVQLQMLDNMCSPCTWIAALEMCCALVKHSPCQELCISAVCGLSSCSPHLAKGAIAQLPELVSAGALQYVEVLALDLPGLLDGRHLCGINVSESCQTGRRTCMATCAVSQMVHAAGAATALGDAQMHEAQGGHTGCQKAYMSMLMRPHLPHACMSARLRSLSNMLA